MTREDSRSLAYHHGIANHLNANPDPVLAMARKNLNRWIETKPAAKALLSRWRQ